MKKPYWMGLFLAFFAVLACQPQNNTEAAQQQQAKATHITSPPKPLVAKIEVQYPQVEPQVRGHIDQLIKDYLLIKDALVEGQTTVAAATAAHWLKVEKNFDYSWFPAAQKKTYENIAKPMRLAAKKLAASSDLELQRQYFEGLSLQTYELAKAFGGATLYYEYCPMAFNDKGAYWLSSSDTILNPYFGSAMLSCGKVVAVLEP